METISVILPIYNAGRYLAVCLDSLIEQTYKQLEMILVNDGSMDNSLEICKAYAERDSRIMIIDKENEGVAIARNVGLEAATGEYVAFVDPDDWVEKEMYESLLAWLKKWASPICLCNFYKDTKRRSFPKCFDFKDEVLEGEAIVEKLVNGMIGVPDLLPKNTMVMGSVWRGLYKRSFIEENNLRFVPKLTIMEDLVFMVQVLLKCEKVAIDQGIWYHYVQHASSALHRYNHQLWEDQLVVYEQLEHSLLAANLLEEEMRNRLDFRFIGMVLTAIKNETYARKEGDFRDTMAHIKEIFTDDTLKCVLERVKPIQVEKGPEKAGLTKFFDEESTYPIHSIQKGDSHQTILKKNKKKRNPVVKSRRKSPAASLYKESKDEYNK